MHFLRTRTIFAVIVTNLGSKDVWKLFFFFTIYRIDRRIVHKVSSQYSLKFNFRSYKKNRIFMFFVVFRFWAERNENPTRVHLLVSGKILCVLHHGRYFIRTKRVFSIFDGIKTVHFLGFLDYHAYKLYVFFSGYIIVQINHVDFRILFDVTQSS